MKLKLITLLLGMFGANLAYADLQQANLDLCEKAKSCAMKSDDMTNMPDNIKKIMMATLDGMCATMTEPYVTAVNEADLEDEALACIESMQDLSCKELEESNKENDFSQSEECQSFKAAADKAGVDFDKINEDAKKKMGLDSMMQGLLKGSN